MRSLALLSALLVGADAFNTYGGIIYSVGEANRVSDKQLFARDIDIQNWSNDAPYINLYLDVPGRVYVTYAKNPSNRKGIFGNIRISGSTEGAVDYVRYDDLSPSTIEDVTLSTRIFNHKASETDSLLVEIELYQKNSLKRIDYSGNGDLVILEDVIYAPSKIPDQDTSGLATMIDMGPRNGSVFVVDPKAEFTTDFFDIDNGSENNNGTLQIELAALNSTISGVDMTLGSLTNVTMFVDRVGDIDLLYMDSASKARNGLCIAAKNDVNVSERVLDTRNTTTRVIPRGSSCVKLPIPARVPALIGGGIGVRESDKTKSPSVSSVATCWVPAVLVGTLSVATAIFM